MRANLYQGENPFAAYVPEWNRIDGVGYETRGNGQPPAGRSIYTQAEDIPEWQNRSSIARQQPFQLQSYGAPARQAPTRTEPEPDDDIIIEEEENDKEINNILLIGAIALAALIIIS